MNARLLHRCLLVIAIANMVHTAPAQKVTTEEVTNLQLKEVSPNLSKLTWDGLVLGPCYKVSYSVYRSREENFAPAPEYLITSGLTVTHHMNREEAKVDTYYHVLAVKELQLSCADNSAEGTSNTRNRMPTTMPRSGLIRIYPLDLGTDYVANFFAPVASCVSASTSEVSCTSHGRFHGVIAAQGGHEFLIGCNESDFESGSWTCVNLSGGAYQVSVHSKTLTVLNSGMEEVDTKSGRRISRITPVFSIMGLIK